MIKIVIDFHNINKNSDEFAIIQMKLSPQTAQL